MWQPGGILLHLAGAPTLAEYEGICSILSKMQYSPVLPIPGELPLSKGSEFCAQKNVSGMTAFLKVVMSLKNSRGDDQSKSVDEILSYGDVAFKDAIAIIRIAYVVSEKCLK